VRLEELRADVLESWFEARIALGDASAVISDAEAAVAEHPLREALWSRLMTALYLSGRQADSLRAYQRLREALYSDRNCPSANAKPGNRLARHRRGSGRAISPRT
jgi:DNA-binding SARP family transcriptional activator